MRMSNDHRVCAQPPHAAHRACDALLATQRVAKFAHGPPRTLGRLNTRPPERGTHRDRVNHDVATQASKGRPGRATMFVRSMRVLLAPSCMFVDTELMCLIASLRQPQNRTKC